MQEPQSATSIKAERILVVAPHPDDESLGCGGLIWHLARENRRFHFVFVTDGGASHPNSRAWPRERLADRREAEAQEALRRLGVGDQPRTFLRLRDADMPAEGTAAHSQALARIEAILHAWQPDLALVPWRRDPHRDHRDSWRLFDGACDRTGIRPSVLEYAIWLSEFGAPEDHPRTEEMQVVAIDIAQGAGAKREAVNAHLTQTSDVIDDDPDGFRLTRATIDRLVGPVESYWRPVR